MLGVKLEPIHCYSIWTSPCEKGQRQTGSALLCEMLRGKLEPSSYTVSCAAPLRSVSGRTMRPSSTGSNSAPCLAP